MRHGGFNHSPTQPTATLTRYTTMPRNTSTIIRGWNKTSIAAKVITALKPVNIAYFRLNKQSQIITQAWNGHQKPNILIQASQLP
jgi:hypothetical protein